MGKKNEVTHTKAPTHPPSWWLVKFKSYANAYNSQLSYRETNKQCNSSCNVTVYSLNAANAVM